MWMLSSFVQRQSTKINVTTHDPNVVVEIPNLSTMEPVAQQEVHVMNAMPQSKETTMNITNDGITEINDKPLHGEWLVDRHGKQK